MSQPGEDDDRDGEGSGEENPPKAACNEFVTSLFT